MSPKPQIYDFAQQLVTSKEYFDRSTRVLEEADSGFRPKPDMMSVAGQIAHVAHTLNWFVQGVTRPEGYDFDFARQAQEVEAVTSIAAARKNLDEAFAAAIAFLRSKSAEEIAAPMPPGPIMGGQPLSDIVWAMVEHTAHHRGALTVYSRSLGKVPPMPYMG
ncbi:MAG TPA: DinB family protein [Bryobacteraceae bacterium]|nr:DinB family protein [Bryobacteraceae bacterium]